jgi:hypothetical protein
MKDMTDYNVDFRFEDGVLHVCLSGKFPKELLGRAENVFQPLIDACSTNNCKKALIDARDLQVDLGDWGLFQAGIDAATLVRFGLRVAFLAREDMLDSFFDDIVETRGGQVGIFTDRDAALDWLQRWPQ